MSAEVACAAPGGAGTVRNRGCSPAYTGRPAGAPDARTCDDADPDPGEAALTRPHRCIPAIPPTRDGGRSAASGPVLVARRPASPDSLPAHRADGSCVGG